MSNQPNPNSIDTVIGLLRSIDATLKRLAVGAQPPLSPPVPPQPVPPPRPAPPVRHTAPQPVYTSPPNAAIQTKTCQQCGVFMKPDSRYKLCFKCGQAARALQADCPTCGKPNSVKPPYTQCYLCNTQARTNNGGGAIAQLPRDVLARYPATQQTSGAYNTSDYYDESDEW